MDKYFILPSPTRLSFWCENFEFFGDKFTNVLKGNFKNSKFHKKNLNC